jgi:hypothetical protein
VDGWALVGGNAHRDHDDDRGEVAVVDLETFEVVERVPMPCHEIYDIVPVPTLLAQGAALGFAGNPARAVEQHRSAGRGPEARPTGDGANVRLVAPRAAADLAAAGLPLPAEQARLVGVRGQLPSEAIAAAVEPLEVEVTNRSTGPLVSALPRPIKVGARWLPLGDHELGDGLGEDLGDAIANPVVPLPRLLPAGYRTRMDVPLEVPAQPGRYQLRVALHQAKVGWFGVRAQAEVTVVAGPGDGTSGLLGPERREQDHVADAVGVGEQHDQPVHADAQPTTGR